MRGSGAPNSNQHSNHPLCHVVWATASVFDVVAKARTVATNFLMFCSTGSTDGVAFVVGVSRFECAASVGKIYTESIRGRGKL